MQLKSVLISATEGLKLGNSHLQTDSLGTDKKKLYIANSLVDQYIGLEETDDGVWSVYFNTVLIATLNERDYIIRG